MIMNIFFRVDSSSDIGLGHLIRCLSLADYFKEYCSDIEIFFISRNLLGNSNYLIKDNQYNLIYLPDTKEDSDSLCGYEKWLTVAQEMDAIQTKNILKQYKHNKLLIIDNYAIDFDWETEMRNIVCKIFVIDDLANRRHSCDFLLDQTYGENMEFRYKNLVSARTKLLIGTDYLLLRNIFYKKRRFVKLRKSIKRILVFFGGCDDTLETLKFLRAVERLKQNDYFIDIIVGDGNLQKRSIEQFCNRLDNVKYYCQVNNIEDYILRADIAFGAAGGALWERCMLGLPSIITVTAENQWEIAKQTNKIGAIKLLGWHEKISTKKYFHELLYLNKIPINEMSRLAYGFLNNGEPKIKNVIKNILE
ncbi:MAG: UDP-2,4-diacetamido-2,4,6-trideoxy-beta-L-altropyranose hydrolase [Selenomonadaceae bacterium]